MSDDIPSWHRSYGRNGAPGSAVSANVSGWLASLFPHATQGSESYGRRNRQRHDLLAAPNRQERGDDPPSRNPLRSYDADGNEIPPMDLGNMREHGVRSVAAIAKSRRGVTRDQ